MRVTSKYIVITDIGSTTTKALLIDNSGNTPELLGIAHSPTTVEAPRNDVRAGIREAVSGLEEKSGLPLLAESKGKDELAWTDDVSYFTTSSAGGGLQILVIGLTLFDSASSAKRCAYGAGGVILDTFAIDDQRQAMEQMLAMRNLHPDMILVCGGTDGGAISGVLRMAEIVRIADPRPKFDLEAKIPAIYAGNKDAAPIIRKLVSKAFDLYVLPNIRPTSDTENLKPTQDKIQQLFMENVMEHAPGYAGVKPTVSAPIIPTPVGVHKSLALIADREIRNIFAFDIGGATTDVFSYINEHFHRTVSANLGMSYSAWNVLRECGLDMILRWLPEDIDEAGLRNYIANKCLNPTANPLNTSQFRIEHALAREALALALEQHRRMHYNTQKMGFLDKLKKGELEKFELLFEYQVEDEKLSFAESDIDVLIGAGGIFAHAQNPLQCAMILIDSAQPKGITELWMDRRFISPHLGVLSESAPETSRLLLEKECVQRLALHIAPAFPGKEKKALLSVEVVSPGNNQMLEVMPDSFHFLPAGDKTLKISPHGKCQLNTELDLQNIRTDLPVMIDTRLEPSSHRDKIEQELGLYPEEAPNAKSTANGDEIPAITSGTWIKRVELPYSGDINFKPGARVQPDDVVAVNHYNPPRLYILNGFTSFPGITPEEISRSLSVQAGDNLSIDQVYASVPKTVKVPHYNRAARNLHSPVRGRIEYIDPDTGLLVVSEIQDYSGKPVKVNYADKLMLKPKKAKRYLLRQEGDFVYQGELLAKRIERTSMGSPPVFVKSPSTGTVRKIDKDSGSITIIYDHDPMEFQANVHGEVTKVVPSQCIEISYEGTKLEGRIAFGRQCHGRFQMLTSLEALGTEDLRDCIVALTSPPDKGLLQKLAEKGVRGVVCHEMDASELVSWLNFEPGVINTGNESLPLAILILNGFGSSPMPAELQKDLAQVGSCFLNPHTRIRAGVVRPFISF
ncbi:MAG: glutamate mutase L [Candidatus Syntrophosphaera sp.]